MNTVAARTIDCVYLGPVSNKQGGHALLDVSTGRVITRPHVTKLPTMTLIIQAMERLAKNDAMTALKFTTRDGTHFETADWIEGGGDSDSDDSDEEWDPESDSDSDSDNSDSDNEEDSDNNEQLDPLEINEILSRVEVNPNHDNGEEQNAEVPEPEDPAVNYPVEVSVGKSVDVRRST